MAASEAVPRVALLARPGDACERISSALREAGADVVLIADPLQSDPEQVRDATPQAILVALDAETEDAIDRYGDVLADPDYMVIFEEADQAAQRTGWDAARWLRHLSAKLHRHGDVLPAGAEVEHDLQPTPGPLPARVRTVDFEEAIVAFTDEAQQHADDVPSDSGLEGLSGLTLALEEPEEDAPPPGDAGETTSVDATEAATADDAAVPASGIDGDADADATGDGSDALDPAGALDADAAELERALAELAASTADDAGADVDEHAFDPERFSRADQAGEASGGIEAFLAAQMAAQAGEEAGSDAAESSDVSDTFETSETTAPSEPAEPRAPAIDFSALSLVEDEPAPAPGDEAAAAPAPADRPGAAFDLDSLGSGLSLADPDSYGHGPLRGAVLIAAGLGGPDAVRQLLAAVPDGFPKPVLVHLPLEGGRYDRLVKQMTRATAAPVAVAEDGQAVQPGSVYFVPPGLGVKVAPSGWSFDASTAFEPAALPGEDGAILFLSGADAALVQQVTAAGWGGLLLGQTPDEGCYDPAAAQAAIDAGADHGAPAALAALLARRWPAAGDGAQ